jgi:hypothetical protein
MSQITINKEQRLYVIPCGKGFTCLGFDVCKRKLFTLANEMGYTPVSKRVGSLKMYNEYQSLIEFARKKNVATGWKSKSELIPEFIGKEGQRVEVVNAYNETERFYIGKSTGFIPCHLQILKSNSSGGGAIMGYPFKKVTFLGHTR